MGPDQLTSDPTFVEDVRRGLTAQERSIPPRWLYDERGSQLFEKITELDEYYLTRTERGIFQAHARDILQACPTPLELVEFGAGSAAKTTLLLQAAIERQGTTTFCPVDISPKAIEMAKGQLLDTFPEHLIIRPVVGSYEEGLAKLDGSRQGPRLILFIGSSIGNFPLEDQASLLTAVARAMGPEDRFLLGTDMAKDREILEPAYDDAEGVTARFTENLLVRMNRELGADFDLNAFEHTARYNEPEHRIEIHLRSLADQTVHLDALDLEVAFDEGELLHTEHSYKYTEALLQDLLSTAGLAGVRSWYDERGWFGVHLLRTRA